MERRKKHPRTYHLPYSPGCTSDDKKVATDAHLVGEKVIATIKMDGENTSLYNTGSHARSLNSVVDSEDRNWIEAFRNTIREALPENLRFCGENLFYRHTCAYDNLKSMFYLHSIWNVDTCLSWLDTRKICSLFEITLPDVIYKGVYDKDAILSAYAEYKKNSIDDVEGFVVRVQRSFKNSEFTYCVNKYVDSDFEVPDTHWRHAEKIKNNLASGKNPWNILYP